MIARASSAHSAGTGQPRSSGSQVPPSSLRLVRTGYVLPVISVSAIGAFLLGGVGLGYVVFGGGQGLSFRGVRLSGFPLPSQVDDPRELVPIFIHGLLRMIGASHVHPLGFECLFTFIHTFHGDAPWWLVC